MRVWPILRDVLARGAGTPRASAAVAQVDVWLSAGGSRLDADLDGKVDSAGAAILDVAWPKLANATLAPVLDAELRQELARLVPNDPALQTDGSSAYSGWWSYVHKYLRTRSSHGPSRAHTRRTSAAAATSRAARRHCGRRSTRPRRARARRARTVRLARRRHEGADRLRAGILTRTMRGSNKPTFQQAITFAHASADVSRARRRG